MHYDMHRVRTLAHGFPPFSCIVLRSIIHLCPPLPHHDVCNLLRSQSFSPPRATPRHRAVCVHRRARSFTRICTSRSPALLYAPAVAPTLTSLLRPQSVFRVRMRADSPLSNPAFPTPPFSREHPLRCCPHHLLITRQGSSIIAAADTSAYGHLKKSSQGSNDKTRVQLHASRLRFKSASYFPRTAHCRTAIHGCTNDGVRSPHTRVSTRALDTGTVAGTQGCTHLVPYQVNSKLT